MATDDEMAFRRAALEIMKSGPPSAGDNLRGMEIDFDGFLGMLDEIDPDSVEVARTKAPESLIRASCGAKDGVSLAVAGEAVRTVWLRNLRYRYKEAHYLRVTEAQAELLFVSQIDPGAFFVTGSVMVHPATGYRSG